MSPAVARIIFGIRSRCTGYVSNPHSVHGRMALGCAASHDVISIASPATRSYAGGLVLSQPVTLLGTRAIAPPA